MGKCSVLGWWLEGGTCFNRPACNSVSAGPCLLEHRDWLGSCGGGVVTWWRCNAVGVLQAWKDHSFPGTRWLGNSYLIPERFMTRDKYKELLPKKIHNTMTYGIPYWQGRVSLLPGYMCAYCFQGFLFSSLPAPTRWRKVNPKNKKKKINDNDTPAWDALSAIEIANKGGTLYSGWNSMSCVTIENNSFSTGSKTAQ
jgi:hypothetical protein